MRSPVSSTSMAVRQRIVMGMILICLVGLLLRIYHVWVTVVISPDGALLIEYARQLGSDPIAALRGFDQHPLYPALIRLCYAPLSRIIGAGPPAWILAGQSVAIAGSLGAILAIYALTARICGRRCGLLAAAMLAVLPDACIFGADVLTDLPHLALYLFGLTGVMIALQTLRWRWLLASSALSALAFLTRPEGGAVLVVGLTLIAFRAGLSWRRRAGLIAAMIATFLCVAGPYQIAAGKLIPKKSPLELFNLGFLVQDQPCQQAMEFYGSLTHAGHELSEPPLAAANLPVPVNVLRQWFRTGRVVYILLAIVGLIVARPRGPAARVLSVALGLHLLLVHALDYKYEYLDRRHALILVALSLPLAAAGTWWLSARIAGLAPHSRRRVRIYSAVGIILICVILTGHWLKRPIHRGEEHVVAAAHWIATNTPSNQTVVSDSRLRRVALYADRPFVEWPWWGGQVHHLAKCLAEHPHSCFVVDRRHITLPDQNPDFFKDLERNMGAKLLLLHTEPSTTHARHKTELRVYQCVDTPMLGDLAE